jgi:TPR repeat protein
MYIKKAADQNYPPAINKVAYYYDPGLSNYKTDKVDKDVNKAIELYTKALELGNHESYVDLGRILVREGLYEKAKKLYSNPAPGHLKHAMRQMGNVKNYIATLHQDSLNMP